MCNLFRILNFVYKLEISIQCSVLQLAETLCHSATSVNFAQLVVPTPMIISIRLTEKNQSLKSAVSEIFSFVKDLK